VSSWCQREQLSEFQRRRPADDCGAIETLSGVGFVRTSLRPDDKNMTLAKNLQSEGIGLVLVTGAEFAPNAKLRPADEKRHMRAAMPLSSADPERSRAYYQTVFDKLDEKGVVLAGVELGNEINWTDFNGDFQYPARGRLSRLRLSPATRKPRRSLKDSCNI
jgi:hypothetical protein